SARFKAGRLVMLGVDTYPEARFEGRRAIGGGDAIQRAIGLGPAPQAVHTDASATPVWLPEEREGELVLRLCYQVRSRTTQPPGIWVSFVDAGSGELLHTYNEVRFASGTVSGRHDTRTVDGRTSVSPMPGVLV